MIISTVLDCLKILEIIIERVGDADTMKHKKTMIFLYIIMAIPIPLSLLTWIPSIMSIASIGMMEIDSARELITAIVSLSAMILAGTYCVSYAVALDKTIKNKGLKPISFLPVLHILLAVLMLYAWSLCE